MLNYFNPKNTLIIINRLQKYVLILFLLVLAIGYFCYQFKENSNIINFQIIQYLFLTICCQFILGVLTLVSETALIIALFHQFLALILLLILVKVKHSLRYIVDVKNI